MLPTNALLFDYESDLAAEELGMLKEQRDYLNQELTRQQEQLQQATNAIRRQHQNALRKHRVQAAGRHLRLWWNFIDQHRRVHRGNRVLSRQQRTDRRRAKQQLQHSTERKLAELTPMFSVGSLEAQLFRINQRLKVVDPPSANPTAIRPKSVASTKVKGRRRGIVAFIVAVLATSLVATQLAQNHSSERLSNTVTTAPTNEVQETALPTWMSSSSVQYWAKTVAQVSQDSAARVDVAHKVRDSATDGHFNYFSPGRKGLQSVLLLFMAVGSGGNPAFSQGGSQGLIPLQASVAKAETLKLSGLTWDEKHTDPVTNILVAEHLLNGMVVENLIQHKAQYQTTDKVCNCPIGLVTDLAKQWPQPFISAHAGEIGAMFRDYWTKAPSSPGWSLLKLQPTVRTQLREAEALQKQFGRG